MEDIFFVGQDYLKPNNFAEIIRAGDWTSARTFQRFYNKPTSTTPIGKTILSRD